MTAGQNGLDPTNNYFSNVTPGLYFLFTGSLLQGAKAFTVNSQDANSIASANVTAALSNPPATLAAAGRTLTLTFSGNTFTGGKILRFAVGRGVANDPTYPAGVAAGISDGGNGNTHFSADLFGGGVLVPEGSVINAGMSFGGTLTDGSTFSGVITNRIGQGYSKLDGFGFIDANAAVNAPVQ